MRPAGKRPTRRAVAGRLRSADMYCQFSFRRFKEVGARMRILLVEDDPMIGKSLQQALQQDGYAVDWVKDGEAARLAVRTGGDAYALVVLDLGLLRRSGLDVLKDM